jgi:hypothetical protein
MGMEIIMKARGSLRIHDNITYTQTTEIYTLSFQVFLSLNFEVFSAGTLWASFISMMEWESCSGKYANKILNMITRSRRQHQLKNPLLVLPIPNEFRHWSSQIIYSTGNHGNGNIG